VEMLAERISIARAHHSPHRLTCMIWLSFVASRSSPLEAFGCLLLSATDSAFALSVYDARSTLDLVRVGGRSLGLLVRSGLVDGLLAAEALRGEGRGC
jgi:hypothetical protein